MNGFIYIIRNTINSKVYIGQIRTSVDLRLKEHLRHARYGDLIINRAMRKYGVDKFYIETLEICTLDVLDYREMYYIDLYDSTNKSKGYNVSIGGNTPRFRRKSLPINELVNLYKNEFWTLSQIAEKFEVTRYIITLELINAGIDIRDRSTATCKFDKLSKDAILLLLNMHLSLRKVAKELNVPYSTLRKACIHYNIEYNSPKSIRQ